MSETDLQVMPEVRERIARLEVKLDYVISHMAALPPSPATLQELTEIREILKEQKEVVQAHTDFIATLKERIAWVTAAFSAVISLAVYGGKWILDHINIAWGSN